MKNLKLHVLIALIFIPTFSSAEEKLTFNWGESHAKVTETITKNNNITILQFDISSTKNKNGFIIRQSNLDIISYQNKPLPPEIKSKLTAALAMPDFQIDKKGMVIEMFDIDGYISRISAIAPNANFEQLMTSPKIKQLILTKLQDDWCTWVCAWSGLTISKENPRTEKKFTNIVGVDVPQTVITQYTKNWQSTKNIRMEITSIIEANEAAKKIQEVGKNLAEAAEVPIPKSDEPLPEFKKTTKIISIFNTKTLKPVMAESDTDSWMKSEFETREDHERKVFTFDWK